MHSSIGKRIGVLLRSFSKERAGNVAFMFTLVFFTLMACVGFAFDTSRINRVRSQVTASLDAAALATAKSLRLDTATDEELKALAKAYFEANLRAQNHTEGRVEELDIVINREKSAVTVSTDVVLPTVIGRLFHVNEFRSHLVAGSLYAARDIELGMMLDVSGSMGGAKIQELRNAAKDLVKIILDDSRGPSKNKIGIAPYSTSVNAGEFAQAATNNPKAPVVTCVTERPGIHAFTDKAPNGAPLGKKSLSCTNSPVVPLTSDLKSLEDQINLLSAGGNTAGHLGIAWAWYIISPNWASLWPAASQPKPYSDPEALKAVILMTDGEFNTSFEPGNGNSSNQGKKLCDNIKAAGIKVFTVGFEAPPAALAVLQYCSSNAKYFFDAKNGNELRDAFNTIAKELTGLRLTM